MYAEYFALRENPFRHTPLAMAHFRSSELWEALKLFAIARSNREPFFLLVGEAGSGKTTVVEAILRSLEPDARVAVVRHPTLQATELVEEVVRRFGLQFQPGESKPTLIARLEQFLTPDSAGKGAVLVIDEAHLLPLESLEEVRLLSNLGRGDRPPLQICLVGQNGLLTKLQQPEMGGLRQRISARWLIGGLSKEETPGYIGHRLRQAGSNRADEIFSKPAADAVFELSGGLPREVNIIADQAMLVAFLDDSSVVTARHVRAAEPKNDLDAVHRPHRAGRADRPADRGDDPNAASISKSPSKKREAPAFPSRSTATVVERGQARSETARDLDFDLGNEQKDPRGTDPWDETELPFIADEEAQGVHPVVVALVGIAILTLLAIVALVYTNVDPRAMWREYVSPITEPLTSAPAAPPAPPVERASGADQDPLPMAPLARNDDEAREQRRPTERLPVETRPTEQRSVETRPTERLPVETRPASELSAREPPIDERAALTSVPEPRTSPPREETRSTKDSSRTLRELAPAPVSSAPPPIAAAADRLEEGVERARAGLWSEAIEAFREAATIEPGYAVAQYNLGLAFLETGQPDHAVLPLRQAVRLEPNEPSMLRMLGVALNKTGELDEAAAMLRKAIRLSPDDVLAHRELSYALREGGDMEGAAEAAARAVALDSDDPGLHEELGFCLYQSGRLQEARIAFEYAIGLDPGRAAAHYSLAAVLHDLGNEADAQRELERARRLGFR